MAFHTLGAPHGGHAEYATATASTISIIPTKISYAGECANLNGSARLMVLHGSICLPSTEAATFPLSLSVLADLV